MSAFMNQFKTVPPVTLVLIVLNVLAFVLLPFMPEGQKIFAEWVISPKAIFDGHYETLITSMFLHNGLLHIVCNMFSLYYLGIMCEKLYGHFRFLVIYLVSGIVGNIVFCVVNVMAGDVTASAVGASGAIFGLFGAYGWILLKEHKFATLLGQPTSKADLQAYAAILVANLAIGFSPGSNIANEAHIGGMIAGFVVGMLFYFSLKQVRSATSVVARAVKPKHSSQQKSQPIKTNVSATRFGKQTNTWNVSGGGTVGNQKIQQPSQQVLRQNGQSNSAQNANNKQGYDPRNSSGDEGRAGQYDPYHTR